MLLFLVMTGLADPRLTHDDFRSRLPIWRARRGDGVLTVPEAEAAHLAGIDVSHYQGSINWSSAHSAGITFAVTKATEGTGYTDPYVNQNIAGMKQVGIIPGAYHFAHPGSDPVAQANFFTSVVRTANGGSYSGLLQLVLDLEVTDGRTPSQVFAWTQSFVARVLAITGRPCIIYTGFYFWRDNVGNPNNNLNCPLWLAAYVSESQTASLTPQAWSGVGWAFWQYTSTGAVPGVSGNVDRDYFRNTGSYPNINNLRIP
jgi:lysozyme